MAINPSNTKPGLNNPTERANQLNDPQFENQQGYYPFDETHAEYMTPLFGEGTPSFCLDTVPGDRIVSQDNVKTILNQINGNFLSTINQYNDTFYVPLRSVFPTNYEKLIPNPTKGMDLPNSALPQFPISAFIRNYLYTSVNYDLVKGGRLINESPTYRNLRGLMQNFSLPATSGISADSFVNLGFGFVTARMLLLSTVLSRGQLLDYLGCSFDEQYVTDKSQLQRFIDEFQRATYTLLAKMFDIESDSNNISNYPLDNSIYVDFYELDLTSNMIDFDNVHSTVVLRSLSAYRDAISSGFEKGLMPIFRLRTYGEDLSTYVTTWNNAYSSLYNYLTRLFSATSRQISAVDADSNPYQTNHISLVRPLAYQQIMAQYYSNNTVDNIFNSELFMQLLRAVMFPSDGSGFTKEPTFLYNGVTTEYDYISYGATWNSLLNTTVFGHVNRQWVWITLMLLKRRTLRYGDYFATARPNMLAVGQLSINIEGGSVSPIDITKNLLMQRYLNAANYIGSGFLPYFASIFGVTPSDTGCFPRFISHRKIELGNHIVENTSNDQGKQTTNLVGYSDNNAFDVFIDDLGVIMGIMSFDVLPVYKSGIDSSYHFSDRFDYFNPMLQNIGDQPIYKSELIGNPSLRDSIFGYTMRNAEYKYKVSRAHGAFVNSLPGYLLSLPLNKFASDDTELKIDSDFIRDKPAYIDSIIPQMTGVSPGEYYHFIVAVVNQVKCARLIQATPPVLF